MTLSGLLEDRLAVAGIEKGELIAFCPFHDDQNTPNLGVNLETQLYHCFACGASGGFDLEKGVVWHKRQSGVSAERVPLDQWPPIWLKAPSAVTRKPGRTPVVKHKPEEFKVVRSYEYCAPEGHVLFIVDRLEHRTIPGKKRFVQRLPGRNANEGINGVVNLPYGAPDIIDRYAHTILLVEGEKCVEELRRHGYMATTFAGGANFHAQKREIDCAVLDGRDVILINDNDMPGKKWVVNAYHVLRTKSTARVSWINSSKLGLSNVGDDIYDWFHSAKGSVEKFDKLIRQAELGLHDPKVTLSPHILRLAKYFYLEELFYEQPKT